MLNLNACCTLEAELSSVRDWQIRIGITLTVCLVVHQVLAQDNCGTVWRIKQRISRLKQLMLVVGCAIVEVIPRDWNLIADG